ncbi:MAG: dicarboxylate/amino acid:cation symporter [Gemmatimonadales bacterium]
MQLHNKILLGLFVGAVAGVTANTLAADAVWLNWIIDNVANPVGQVFLRMLLMTVVPLVFASITLGVAGIGNIKHLGGIGGRTLAYFLFSTTVSVVIGLTLVNTFHPGAGLDPALRQQLMDTYQTQTEGLQQREVALDVSLLVNMVPRNAVQAAANMDMLAVIFFSIVFGAALTLISKDRAAPMLRLLEALGDVVIKIIDFAMKLAPYGVFGLIFVVTSRFGWNVLGELGGYVAIVVAGLFIHGAVGLSLFVKFFARRSPLEFWKKIRAVMVTAFSTSSSNATLPTSIKVAEEELGISPKVAGFVLPLGATMNMNGTSLYEGITVLFLAQVFGVDLNVGQQLVVLLLSVITAVGAAGVPGGSLPLIMVMLATVGVPAEGIGIILGVDRILDMCRTTVNVAGDLSAAAYIDRIERRPEATTAA